jgi:hypothetical protein
MQRLASTLAFLLTVILLVSPVRATVMYDGSLGTAPASQGWLYVTNPVVGALATQSVSGGAVTLDSTPDGNERAGYFNTVYPSTPVLDRAAGFTVRFTMRLRSEEHRSADRAGFSVIAISSDRRGLELAFWMNEVWAQNDSNNGPAYAYFTHGEGAGLDANAGLVQYDLAFLGSTYWVLAGGGQVLTGAIRDYTGYTGALDPYETPNFLFFGDDTGSASARTEISRFEVLNYATPEPASLLLLAVGALGLLRRRVRD